MNSRLCRDCGSTCEGGADLCPKCIEDLLEADRESWREAAEEAERRDAARRASGSLGDFSFDEWPAGISGPDMIINHKVASIGPKSAGAVWSMRSAGSGAPRSATTNRRFSPVRWLRRVVKGSTA